MVLRPQCPDLSAIDVVLLARTGSLVPYFVTTASVAGGKAFLKLEDVDSIEEANSLKGSTVWLEKAARPKLKKGNFYNDEVISFSVWDENAGELGSVREVQEAGPNRFLIVDRENREVMIPVNGPFIKSIQRDKKKIMVSLPEGFLEL